MASREYLFLVLLYFWRGWNIQWKYAIFFGCLLSWPASRVKWMCAAASSSLSALCFSCFSVWDSNRPPRRSLVVLFDVPLLTICFDAGRSCIALRNVWLVCSRRANSSVRSMSWCSDHSLIGLNRELQQLQVCLWRLWKRKKMTKGTFPCKLFLRWRTLSKSLTLTFWYFFNRLWRMVYDTLQAPIL